MEEVTVTRRLDVPPEAVRDTIRDVGPFTEAAGFDEVTAEDGAIYITNMVGILTVELTLTVLEDADAALAYEQRDGMFESMRTTYEVAETDDGSTVTATTEFALDVALVGEVLDATVIKRQRRKELTAQFDWLETVCVG